MLHYHCKYLKHSINASAIVQTPKTWFTAYFFLQRHRYVIASHRFNLEEMAIEKEISLATMSRVENRRDFNEKKSALLFDVAIVKTCFQHHLTGD